MIIKNVSEEKEYVEPEDISLDDFFVDENTNTLYYLMADNYKYAVLKFGTSTIETEISVVGSDPCQIDAIQSAISDCSKLVKIEHENIKLTYRIRTTRMKANNKDFGESLRDLISFAKRKIEGK